MEEVEEAEEKIREEEEERMERERRMKLMKPVDPRLKKNFYYNKGVSPDEIHLRSPRHGSDDDEDSDRTPTASAQTPYQPINLEFKSKLPNTTKSLNIK